jgi:hypothetical protein
MAAIPWRQASPDECRVRAKRISGSKKGGELVVLQVIYFLLSWRGMT